MLTLLRKNTITYVFLGFSLLFYAAFAYDLDRTDLPKLFGLYGALFYFFYQIYGKIADDNRLATGFGILSRLIFLIAIPNLSQDFYRFLWDGHLLIKGMNPYTATPEALISNTDLNLETAQRLIQGMGSLNASHYSNYPPLNQLFFAIAAFLGGSNISLSVFILRLFIIGGDIVLLHFGKKVLKLLGKPAKTIYLYFLNPFVIIELTGNLHFEGVMMALAVISIYFLLTSSPVRSALFLGLSILVKLIPLMFLPLYFSYFNGKISALKGKAIGKATGYLIITSGVVILGFLPFYSITDLSHFSESIMLWFGKFEFNASFYYILRGIGYIIKGYNTIETLSKSIALVVFVSICWLALFNDNREVKKLLTAMLFAVSLYLFTATTVHPWYITVPLILCLFTEYRFPVVWSGVVILSYHAYASAPYNENFIVLALEYLVLYGYLIYEVRRLLKASLG
ncbi:mannosyltransferase [Robertkochia solimangrovi]|nr:mannosyltransferase [Robertkochia solimangrovi]